MLSFGLILFRNTVLSKRILIHIGQQGQSSRGGSDFEARGGTGGVKKMVFQGGGDKLFGQGGGGGGIAASFGLFWQLF